MPTRSKEEIKRILSDPAERKKREEYRFHIQELLGASEHINYEFDEKNALIEVFALEHPKEANILYSISEVLDNKGRYFKPEELIKVKEIFHEIENKPQYLLSEINLQNFDSVFEDILQTRKYQADIKSKLAKMNKKLDELLKEYPSSVVVPPRIHSLKVLIKDIQFEIAVQDDLPKINTVLERFYTKVSSNYPRFLQEFKELQANKPSAAASGFFTKNSKNTKKTQQFKFIVNMDTKTSNHLKPLELSIDKIIKKQKALISAAGAAAAEPSKSKLTSRPKGL